MARYYIFDSEKEALLYEQEVTNLRNYRNKSNHWSNIKKQVGQERYAVVAYPSLVVVGLTPEPLSEDWEIYKRW